jgi:hypothetical protein
MEFYHDNEPWTFPVYQYPTWDDVMRFYMSRIKQKIPPKAIINKLAEEVEKIWKLGDGCPTAVSSIRNQFEKYVLPQYQKYRKGDGNKKGRKQKKGGTPAQSPARRSLRAQPDLVDAAHDAAQDPAHLIDEEGGDQGEQASSSAAVQVHQSNRK